MLVIVVSINKACGRLSALKFIIYLERDKISVDDIIWKQVLRDTVWIQNAVEMNLVTKKITGEGGLVQKTS